MIEAKSRKDADNPLYKKDHAQLLEAEQWFKTNYRGRPASLRVSALREAVAESKASPSGTMALKLDALAQMSGALRRVLEAISTTEGEIAALEHHCEVLLDKEGLTSTKLGQTFLVPFVKK